MCPICNKRVLTIEGIVLDNEVSVKHKPINDYR